MNKKILVILGIIIVVIGFYFFFLKPKQSEPLPQPVSQTSTTTSVSKGIPATGFPYQSLVSFGKTISFTDKSTGTTVTFRGTLFQAPNPGSNLYIGNVLVGSVEGWGVASSSFSGDNTKFAFVVPSVCGAGCWGVNINVLTLSTKKILTIKPPRSGDNISPFIESLTWTDPNTLQISFFSVKMDGTGTQVSPKEIWDYSLLTNTYKLVSTAN
jgi:hypothetical protein